MTGGTLNIGNCTFDGFTTTENGGAIYAVATGDATTAINIFGNTTIQNCSAARGGAIYTLGTITISDSTLSNNFSTANTDGVGGGPI
jgi:predicted outer membrane repeat protein